MQLRSALRICMPAKPNNYTERSHRTGEGSGGKRQGTNAERRTVTFFV
jgi:hypothetical protein